MRYRYEVCSTIAGERVLAVVRTDSRESAVRAGGALAAAGIRAVEVALTTPGGIDAVRDLAEVDDGRVVGAGTVLDAASARSAILAGARFLVSPAVSAEVIEMGHRYGAAVLPGAQTPTEIEKALSLGADMIKLFPASSVGPSYLSAVRAALPQAPLVPTGGVGAGNAAEWLDAGAVAVGVGGSLTSGDPETMDARARELLAAVGRSPERRAADGSRA